MTPNGYRVAPVAFSFVTGFAVANAIRIVTRIATESCCIRFRTTAPESSEMTPSVNILNVMSCRRPTMALDQSPAMS